MKREWFEPGPDGESPFSKMFRKYCDEGMLVSESIAAAFCALLAGEDVGRTADAKDAEIARLRAEAERLTAERDDMTTRAHDECQRANNWKDECQFHKDRAYTAIAERDALQARFDAGVPEVCKAMEVGKPEIDDDRESIYDALRADDFNNTGD